MKYAILGPTASGKSSFAVAVARRVGGVVVNGDPYQAIEGLSIGSGQPAENERASIPHVGYGCLPLSTRPNPADFGAWVRERLMGVENPVLVTGSGLYLRGIWEQLTELPPVPGAVVQKMRRLNGDLGTPLLHRYLRAVDPVRAEALHPNDQARVSRAMALHLATGRKPSDLLTGLVQGIPDGWRALVVLPEREALRRRIAIRVKSQIQQGWAAEVESLLKADHREDLLALRPLGYEAWIEGGELERIEAGIVMETQYYAKRQSTWFRNQLGGVPSWDPDTEPMEAAFEKLGI